MRQRILEDLIQEFRQLAADYSENRRLTEAVTLSEQLSVVLELFSHEVPALWGLAYLSLLEELVFTYLHDGQQGNAVRAAKKRLNRVTALYQDCPREWAREYSKSMFLLAAIYDIRHLSTRFRELRDEGLAVTRRSGVEGNDRLDGEESWSRYRKKVASYFTEDRPTGPKMPMVTQLENRVASRWNRYKTGGDCVSPELHREIRDLSIAYTKLGRIPGAVALERMRAVMLSDLHRTDPAAWIRRRIECQYRQAILYHMARRPESAEGATKEGLRLLSENPELSDFQQIRARFMSTQGFVFLTKREPEKAIGLLSEALDILRSEGAGARFEW